MTEIKFERTVKCLLFFWTVVICYNRQERPGLSERAKFGIVYFLIYGAGMTIYINRKRGNKMKIDYAGIVLYLCGKVKTGSDISGSDTGNNRCHLCFTDIFARVKIRNGNKDKNATHVCYDAPEPVGSPAVSSVTR